jgi:hypothetical protein
MTAMNAPHVSPPERVARNHRRLPSLSTLHDSIEHASQSQYRSTSAENVPTLGNTDTPEKLFPHDSLLSNIHRFMRCSSAAYGQNFLRIFGMGTTEFTFPSTGKHHANTWSFVSRHSHIEPMIDSRGATYESADRVDHPFLVH